MIAIPFWGGKENNVDKADLPNHTRGNTLTHQNKQSKQDNLLIITRKKSKVTQTYVCLY